jgi:hypothetical protein
MQIQYEIQRSLKGFPPNYGKGITHIERKSIKLDSLVTLDSKGVSLNPREKELETPNHEGLTFETQGVLYDKETMVCELRNDNQLELLSGFGRKYYFEKKGINTYFLDVIKFDNDYWKALWKRRWNSSKDHTAKGIPNTEGSFLLGLSEARKDESFNWKDDNECMEALAFMAKGSKSTNQLEKLLKKFRLTNHKDDNVRALNTEMANEFSIKMGLPHKGYCNDLSKSYYDRIGYNIYNGDFSPNMKKMIDFYDKYETPIELYGFIQHIIVENLPNDRANLIKDVKKTIKWMNKHFSRRYKDIVTFKGFHAQLRTRNPADGGRATERGIVDVKGNILIDFNESLPATLF